jgi:D-apiose dehydrogenase
MGNPLKGGLIGCGYFSANHLNAWRDVEGADLTAVCDLDLDKAQACAAEFGIEAVYSDPEVMLSEVGLDFVDIVTQPHTHRELVELAARHRTPVICQKPMAPSLAEAEAMVSACDKAGVPFMVHENFRWQAPMRAVAAAAAEIGPLFFGRISFRSAFDVYTDQPYLATDPRFIIYDLGVHALDLARFFMGEVGQLCCHTQRVNPAIRAEDVATMLLTMQSGASCIVDISYASQLPQELFPQTLVHLEGSQGTVSLGPHFDLMVIRGGETLKRQVAPSAPTWASPPAEAIQESVPRIQQHWVESLLNRTAPETGGADNLRTLELVFGAYEAAASRQPYRTGEKLAN